MQPIAPYDSSSLLLPAPVVTTVAAPARAGDGRRLSILGVRMTDVSVAQAIELMEDLICRGAGSHTIFFANAHTLNLAAADDRYRAVLNAADHVLGDGTGVRWAARLQGVRVRANLNGTDLVPQLFHATTGRGYRYFLLGARKSTIDRAAALAAQNFPGWTQAGFHHGHLADGAMTSRVIRQINQCRPDLLLVGMGNPRQERWIHAHRERLEVPLCLGVGGLFDFWAGAVHRAPAWLRAAGHEWFWRLLEQPGDKAKRYLLGNPLFLWRVLREMARRGSIPRSQISNLKSQILTPLLACPALPPGCQLRFQDGNAHNDGNATSRTTPCPLQVETCGNERHLPDHGSAARRISGRVRKHLDGNTGPGPFGRPVVCIRSSLDRHAVAGAAVPLVLAGMARLVSAGARSCDVAGGAAPCGSDHRAGDRRTTGATTSVGGRLR
jgi:N-acetylglucosaminyldiphosphoundecaprenol N-acetyl-beta-D-mannosaminyltransferase